MTKDSVVRLGILLIPPLAVITFPKLGAAGLWLLLSGFILLVLTSLIATFRRHPLGPFAQWVAPREFIAMRFSRSELWWLKLSATIALSGLLCLGLLLIRAQIAR
jgi:hypothetical protein